METSNNPAVVVDFQRLYAALTGDERDPETGRYPERQDRHSFLLPMVEYLRRTAITGAQQRTSTPSSPTATATGSAGTSSWGCWVLGRLRESLTLASLL